MKFNHRLLNPLRKPLFSVRIWIFIFIYFTLARSKRPAKHLVAEIRGDIMLGGLFPVHTSDSTTCNAINPERGIQRVEAMLFTLDEINDNTNLLPGLKLGATIRDTCSVSTHALEQALKFVQTSQRAPCPDPMTLATSAAVTSKTVSESWEPPLTRGVVGSSYSSVSILVANLFRLFSLPQISYASTSAILSDKRAYPLFARTVPSDVVQARAMATLVSDHNWTYVSTVRSAGDYGDSGMDAFWKEADKLGVCIAAREVIRSNMGPEELDHIVSVLRNDFAKARVVVLFTGMDHTKLLLDAVKRAGLVDHFVWIASDGWGRENVPVSNNSREANGALTIEIQAKQILPFNDYYLNLTQFNRRNPWFKEYWQELFHCTFDEYDYRRRKRSVDNYSDSEKRYFMGRRTANNTQRFKTNIEVTQNLCSNEPHLRLIDRLGHDFKQEAKIQFVHDAVYAFAYGLNKLQQRLCSGNPMSQSWNKRLCVEKMLNYSGIDFYHLILNTTFTNKNGDTVAFDENGDGNGQYSIYNYARDPHTGQYNYRLVGDYQRGKLTMRARPIWPGGQSTVIPVSQCSEECGFGEIRRLDKKQQCCWSCEACAPNQRVVNLTHCENCPFKQWPSKSKDSCEVLELHYIDISTWFAIVPMTFSGIGICITLSVILTWHLYSETPLVRATGRELAYFQLAGCLVCYASPFILLANPSIFTCTMQRIFIGLGFAMMYASLLTKTNRIARIFEAAKRTTKRPAYISPRSQLVIAGALITLQLSLSAIWFGFDSPDTRIDEIRPGYLVLRCAMKDKSFLISLAYNVILIIVCTAYAFKTRHIPENFNESKFIGFAMYTTCIIWLAFLPLYYATMHNHEIQITTLCLAISLSASVMLCCLFFPKLYIIYLHPEKNVRRLTMNNTTAKQKFAQLIKTQKNPTNPCTPGCISNTVTLTVSSSTRTEDSDKLISSPAITFTNPSLTTNFEMGFEKPIQSPDRRPMNEDIFNLTTCTPRISVDPISHASSTTLVNANTTDSITLKPPMKPSAKFSPTCTNMPAPTPLMLDNIPNRQLLNSLYCDETNSVVDDDDYGSCPAVAATTTPITTTTSTILVNKYLPTKKPSTTSTPNRYVLPFSPTNSIGSIESRNFSAHSSELYSHSIGDDTMVPISETSDSPSRDSSSLFVQMRKQDKQNQRIDFTKQTVTAL